MGLATGTLARAVWVVSEEQTSGWSELKRAEKGKKKMEITNQDNSFEEFCSKGMGEQRANTRKSRVKGGLFIGLFVLKMEKYQHICCDGIDSMKSKRAVMAEKDRQRREAPGWGQGGVQCTGRVLES